MKKRALLVMSLCLCVGVLTGCATRGSAEETPAANLAVEETRVREVLAQFFEAAKKRDWDAAGKLMAEDFEIYTDDASRFDKKAYVELLKADDLELKEMQLKEQQVRVSGDGRMAWMKYRGFFNCVSHGKPHVVETAETLIFQKEGGEWKWIRAHASVKAITAPDEK